MGLQNIPLNCSMNIAGIIWLKSKGYLLFTYLLHALAPNRFLEIATIFLSLLIISVIILILFYLLQKAKLKQRQLSFQKKFNDLISEIAICESEEELNGVFINGDYQKIFDQYQRKQVDRNFMIDELARICKEFSGVARTNIHWLFQKTSLKSDLLKQLKDKRWYVVAKTIQQIAYLQLKDLLPNIFLLANHNDDLVRMEAQIATVKLVGFDGLRFLNVICYTISEWQQLRLIQELSEHTIKKFDSIENWLRSKNSSVVEFALRLVGIYQRYEFYDHAAQYLSHSSECVTRQAVESLGKINNEKTAESLIAIFPSAAFSIRYQIADTLKIIGTEKDMSTLQELFNYSSVLFNLEGKKENDPEVEAIEEGAVDKTSRLSQNVILPKLNMGGAI